MNVEIGQLSVSLRTADGHGADALGADVAGQVQEALREALTRLDGIAARGGATRLDLGRIDAPAGADARAVAGLIAARLALWLSPEPGAMPSSASTSTSSSSSSSSSSSAPPSMSSVTSPWEER